MDHLLSDYQKTDNITDTPKKTHAYWGCVQASLKQCQLTSDFNVLKYATTIGVELCPCVVDLLRATSRDSS